MRLKPVHVTGIVNVLGVLAFIGWQWMVIDATKRGLWLVVCANLALYSLFLYDAFLRPRKLVTP